jgi:hypothetical protein
MKLQELLQSLIRLDIIKEAKLPAESYENGFNIISKKLKEIGALTQQFIQKILQEEDFISNDIDALDIDSYFIKSVKELHNRMFEDNIYRTVFSKELANYDNYLKMARESTDGNFRYRLISEYIPNILRDIIDVLDKEKSNYSLRNIINNITEFENRAVGYGFTAEELDRLLPIFAIIKEVVNKTEEVKEFVERINTLTKWNRGEYYDSRNFRPEDLQEEEIAYHASIDIKNIFQNGFQKEYTKTDKGGLGGASYKGDISFSLSLHICQSIMIALKHMWLIANGKYRMDKLIDYIKKYSANTETSNFENTVKQYKRRKGSEFPPKSSADAIEFYLTALWYMDSPVYRNPVFMDTQGDKWVEKLSKIDYSDIGIVEARIKTTNASEFLVAEREIRIPPEDVIEMKRIIQ